MKKLLLITFLFSNLAAYGQITEAIVSENKLWSSLWQSASGGPDAGEMHTSFVKFSGDTVIDDENYKKVFESTDSAQEVYSLTGFIREDAENKVFYKSLNEPEERLLYDFGAEEGDSINIGEIMLVVDSVDSVFIHDKYLKRMILAFDGEPGEEWIEGIGSMCGILASGSYWITGGKYVLLCFYDEQELFWSHPDYDECYYSTVGIGEFEATLSNIKIYPNPVVSASVISIEGRFKPEMVAKIYTSAGIKVKTIKLDSPENMIYRKDYLPGVYIVKVISGNKMIASGKFLVK